MFNLNIKEMREKLKTLLSKEVLEEEFKKGLWHKDIAEKYNVSWRQIYYLVKDYNINIPRKNKKKIIQKHQCKKCGKYFKVVNDEGYCFNCEQSLSKLYTEQYSDGINTDLHEKIINLRKSGLSYSKIANKLHCNKSTVSYHCNQKTKDNVSIRTLRRKQEDLWKHKLIHALDDFKRRSAGNGKHSTNKDWNKKLRTSVSHFRLRSGNRPIKNYTYKDVIDYFNGPIVTCALTGRKIDILKDDYHLDHIIPVSKGGSNELDNMEFVIPEANNAKSDLTLEEFVCLCKEVCENFGYEVSKKESI